MYMHVCIRNGHDNGSESICTSFRHWGLSPQRRKSVRADEGHSHRLYPILRHGILIIMKSHKLISGTKSTIQLITSSILEVLPISNPKPE